MTGAESPEPMPIAFCPVNSSMTVESRSVMMPPPVSEPMPQTNVPEPETVILAVLQRISGSPSMQPIATLLACLVTYAARNLCIKRYPLLSFLSPVIFNGLIVGAEIAYFTTDDTFWHAYLINGASVAFGEIVVVFILGTALFFAILKNEKLKQLLR